MKNLRKPKPYSTSLKKPKPENFETEPALGNRENEKIEKSHPTLVKSIKSCSILHVPSKDNSRVPFILM